MDKAYWEWWAQNARVKQVFRWSPAAAASLLRWIFTGKADIQEGVENDNPRS